MQVLASLPVFLDYLESLDLSPDETPVSSELLRLSLSLRRYGDVPTLPWAADPTLLLQLVRATPEGMRFSLGEQHDVLEWLQCLMALVAHETKQKRFLSIEPSSIPQQRNLPNPFKGLMDTSVVCEFCMCAKPARLEQFVNLECVLAATLHASIAASLQPEILECVECLRCTTYRASMQAQERLALIQSICIASPEQNSTPNAETIARHVSNLLHRSCFLGETDSFCFPDLDKKRNLTATLLDLGEPIVSVRRRMLLRRRISRLPLVLCLHIVRMIGVESKQNSRIKFPLQLDFIQTQNQGHVEFVLEEEATVKGHKQHRYLLSAVVQHHGYDRAGHYTVFAKCPQTSLTGICPTQALSSQWIHSSDHKITWVDKEEVLRASDVTILFYTRCSQSFK